VIREVHLLILWRFKDTHKNTMKEYSGIQLKVSRNIKEVLKEIYKVCNQNIIFNVIIDEIKMNFNNQEK
jgi:hypothetical protein